MKILIVNTLYHPQVGSGAELVVRNQVQCLADLGHEVSVLTVGVVPGLHTDRVDGVEVYRVGFLNAYFHGRADKPSTLTRTIWHLRDIYNRPMNAAVDSVLGEACPDIAVFHNIAGFSISIYDSFVSARIPIVQVLHDQYFLCVKSSMFADGARCERRCLGCRMARLPHKSISRKAVAVVGVSEFILRKVLRLGYFENIPIRAAILNIAHHDTRWQGAPIEVKKRRSLVVFGYIGTLAANKGIELLLHTFLTSQKSNWRLSIAGSGDGRYVSELRSRFDDARISFHGRVDASSFYPTLDACIVPSLWEDTLPSVVFEALLAGVPVLGSRSGGIPEMVEPGTDGLLFEPDEPELYDAMCRLAEDLPSWRSRSTAIRQRAEMRFKDKVAWARRWEALLGQALDVSRAAASTPHRPPHDVFSADEKQDGVTCP